MTTSFTAEITKQLGHPIPWEDLSCILWHNGLLYTSVTSSYSTPTGCNGKINVWDTDLNLKGEFQAHEYAIYHMCSGPGNTIYTCASDSSIRHWQLPTSTLEACDGYKLLNCLVGHMEPPWRLQFFNNRLFSGDALGEIRLWENDCYKGVLETYEEIWDLVVIKKMIFTVRFLDVTIITIPDDEKKACSVKNHFPGRGPLFVSGNMIFCLDRNNFDIMVHLINEDQNPLIKVLKGHNMLVNGFVGDDDYLFSGDYEGKVIAWDLKELKQVAEIWLKENGCVNAMAYDPEQKVVYLAQDKKYVTKLVIEYIQ